MSDGVPQFATAEYSGKPGDPACKSCGQAISGAYYRVNAAPTCTTCAQRIKEQTPKDSHSAFVRGVLFGVGGARLCHQLGAAAAFRRLILTYMAWGSPSISVETNRRIGDSVDSFEAGWVYRENKPGETFAHMLGQSSMGNGASNIEGGISALNFITAALDLNSGHAYSASHRSQRFTSIARFL